MGADWIDKAGTWIDRSIGVVAPGRALKRQAAREGLKFFSSGGSYRGSKSTRLNYGWATRQESADAALYGELEILRNRSRDLVRNDAVAAGATETIVVNTVKNGLTPQSRIRGANIGLSDDQVKIIQDQAEAVYEKWSPFADVSGRLDFEEIQALAIRQIVESGEFLAVRRAVPATNGRPYLLALDIIEPDRLGYMATPAGKDNRFGIDYDENNAPRAYHIMKGHPGDVGVGANWADETVVPAKDPSGRPLVFHLFPLKRPGQSRGVPFFAPVIDYFKTLADYIEAELVAARIAACFSVFITGSANPYGYALGRSEATQTNPAGTTQRLQNVEPGMIEYLADAQNVHFGEPKHPGNTFDSFVERLLRLIGTSLGLPYELILKDFSKTNYSSARAALIQAYRFFQVWQEFLRKKLCQPVWEILLEEAWLRGEITAPRFMEKKWEYTRASWIVPGWPYVNPLDEVNANEKAIKMGLKSRAQICAEQGDDWEETAEQVAKEKLKFDELGIPWQGVDAAVKEAKNNAPPEDGGGNAGGK